MEAIITGPTDIGRLVKRTRAAQGLTQAELADRLGVSQRWLFELEAGKGKQLNERYFSVLAALGISLTARADYA